MKKQKVGYTLGQWLAEWYNVYKLPVLAKSSLENIERVVRLHIPAWLKEMKLKELTAFDIDKALASVPSTRMRKYAHSVLHGCLFKAYCLDYIAGDIMQKVEHVRHRSKVGEALSVAEQRAFFERVGDHYMRDLFEFYLYTGVRRCEALALRWSDIDFENERLLIRGTKSAFAVRDLPLLPPVRALLERQKLSNVARKRAAAAKKAAKAAGVAQPAAAVEAAQTVEAEVGDAPVFPFKPCMVDRVFHKFCPLHRLHDLRHTFVTRCAECNINPNVCQSLAGHGDIKMTLQTYTHASTQFRKEEYSKFRIEP